MKLREILPPDAEFDAHLAATRHRRGDRRQSHGQTRRRLRRHCRRQNRRPAFRAGGDRRGRGRIVAERPPQAPLPGNVAFMRVHNARRALALIAAKFFPRQPRIIAAVTGTSGKTSVAAFTRQIWSALGYRAASIGTIGIVSPHGETYGSLTTPDPVELHRSLDALAGDGVTHLAIEASSHGLDQHRLDGLRIAAGGFTNFSRDHLDYHPTFEAYLAAKLRLFDGFARARRRGGDRRRSRSRRCGGGGGKGARPDAHDRRAQGHRNSSRSFRHRRLRAAAAARVQGGTFPSASAAGRRISGRERARCRRACHRDRWPSRLGLCGAGTTVRRQRPARTRRRKTRRADFYRLCP